MTSTASMLDPASRSSVLDPSARRIWRSARGPVIVGAIVIAAAIVIMLLSGSNKAGSLEPESVTPDGSRAIARLLKDYRVQVSRVDTVAGAAAAVSGDTTLLVARPDWVPPDRLADLVGAAGHSVLVGPQGEALRKVLSGVDVRATVTVQTREPECAFDAARTAGNARIGGVSYHGPTTCYGGTLVSAGKITVLGDGTPLTNDVLDEDGNAALALHLLGPHPRVVWYMPSLSEAAGQQGSRSFFDLVPGGWKYGLIMAAIAVVLLALWRGRRLGPVVTEPLPIVVRAAETTEGRARLYRRARATDHAATALRQATVGRLLPMLGLAVDASPAAVVERVAERTGRPGPEIHPVLYGPPPSTEQALVHLANALDNLTNEVRTK
ncbi:DUF4350 domain-containing protein [Actinocrispum wychmicini]|uniref:Uncharacterized protein DUF4350 n=1 Tax=Actinocrispum wychmicini TaxID=1213861 RepID=A0A4R2JYV9_9PSEU|nr:DUF4350 domain-containing protein [Actinocrispum wychmicini]TCO62459.1 uncharacterized protein DUF4350 [Actinocrispum wychmicini]